MTSTSRRALRDSNCLTVSSVSQTCMAAMKVDLYKSVASTVSRRLWGYVKKIFANSARNKLIELDTGSRTAVEVLQNPPSLSPEVPAGFTIGKTIEPGVVSQEFKERLSVLGGYSQFGLYEPSELEPMTAWLLNLRPTTFLERCWIGWTMWRDGVAKYPWPVAENKEFRK